jgi:glycosyltransferase involved in cell wall biosynthesis
MRIAVKPDKNAGAVSWFRGTRPASELAEIECAKGRPGTGRHQVAFLHSQLMTQEAQKELVRTADVVHIVGPGGEFSAAGDEWRERRGILSVDLDDDVWMWERDPASKTAEEKGLAQKNVMSEERLRGLESWLRAADVITTTTPYLQGRIGEVLVGKNPQLAGRIKVIPNCIPKEAKRRRAKRGNVVTWSARKGAVAPKVVGWTGSVAHVADLPPILEALARVRSVDATVMVRSLGPCDFMQAPGFREVFQGTTDYTPVVRQTPDGKRSMLVPFEEYYDFLEAMEPQVALIPMRSSPFNMAKSAVTLYSWAVQGVPCICSDVGPYREAKAEGFPAVYVPHEDIEAWVRELRELLYDPFAARKLGERALAWVEEHHSFPDGAKLWEEVWEGAVARGRRRELEPVRLRCMRCGSQEKRTGMSPLCDGCAAEALLANSETGDEAGGGA